MDFAFTEEQERLRKEDHFSKPHSASDYMSNSSYKQDGEVYLPEILISTRAMSLGFDELQPYLAGADIHKKGIVVLGTVEGDMHDIGKNLVGMMLESNGFNIIDLGIDVPADTFVSAVREQNANIIAMSALLTTTMSYIP